VLGIDVPRDDLVIIDPRAAWTPTAAELRSLGKNTPLLGRPLVGRVSATYVAGRLRHELPAAVTA
jgi:dihydroorotase